MQGRQEPGDNQQDPRDRSATSGYRFSEELGKRRNNDGTGAYRFSEELEKYRNTGGTGAYRFSDLTGRQPVVPKRPPGMSPHLDGPPPTPRVARPASGRPRKPRTWKWWTGALVILVVGGILAGMLIYGAKNLVVAVSTSLGPANTASDFLASLQSANYDQAYSHLDATVTVQTSDSNFKQMALADDHCYGQVTNYQEVNGSATTSADQNTQSFAYTITRSKLSKSYQLTLV
ncbi:MAG TPA: hypothetical protein VGM01_00895, partial [Ktedonobacteraceae bacterium]